MRTLGLALAVAAVLPFQSAIRPLPAAVGQELVAHGDWHSGCPVPLSGLRLLTVRAWSFGGRPYHGQLIINARSQTAATLATFRRAFSEGRCLVPADGFYEWQGKRSERRPLWFHDPGEKPLAFAGLVEEYHGSPAFVIRTTAANGLVRSVHDRIPVLLSSEGAEA